MSPQARVASADTRTARRGRIDVHHHVLPPAFVAAVDRRGLRDAAEAPLPEWTVERSLAAMDANRIETAILSLPAPGTFLGQAQEACDLARACNEYVADLGERHPGRFGSFAALPTPFVTAACAEAVHALDHLGADGVVLLGSSEGRFLGDPAYDDLMFELDARHAVVFVQPNLHPTSRHLGVDEPAFLLEFPCDVTRAALHLILTGTVERFPRIRWLLANAGGFLPYVAWRIALANAIPVLAGRAPKGVLSYARRFYYDTALAPSRHSMAALRELAKPDRILFGSDFPFAPEPLLELQCRTLEETVGRQHGIDRAHALNLLRRRRDETEVSLPSSSAHPRFRARGAR